VCPILWVRQKDRIFSWCCFFLNLCLFKCETLTLAVRPVANRWATARIFPLCHWRGPGLSETGAIWVSLDKPPLSKAAFSFLYGRRFTIYAACVAFNPTLVLPLLSKGPVGQEEGKLRVWGRMCLQLLETQPLPLPSAKYSGGNSLISWLLSLIYAMVSSK